MDLPVSKYNEGPIDCYKVIVDYGDYDIMEYYFEGSEGLRDACSLFNYAVQNGLNVAAAKGTLNEGSNFGLINDWEEYSLRS